MKFIFIGIWLIFSTHFCLIGQQGLKIEGKVSNGVDGKPLAYANIYNFSTQEGTISNQDGYFRLELQSWNDSIRVSFIGYEDHLISPKKAKNYYEIVLESSPLLLDEILIRPEDDSYLVEMIHQCKPAGVTHSSVAKAYYELKSFVDGDQVELVESYYNLHSKKYRLEEMNFKTGRIALQPHENRFFTSMESSKVLIMLDLFKGSEFFPSNPLEMSKYKLKKHYYLFSDHRYLDENGDSIQVIAYQPKVKSGRFFEGKIWVNTSKKAINKITLIIDDAATHPFLPLFELDKIARVQMNISISYNTSGQQLVFNHMDFSYIIDYESRYEKEEAKKYTVKTNAVLYAYDYNSSFFIPLFDFRYQGISDYRKISAFPYNDFFWEKNNEYRLNDRLNTNDLFFNNLHSLTNRSIFKPNEYFHYGIFEHEFILWSENRLRIKEAQHDPTKDPTNVHQTTDLLKDRMKLSVKIFLDLNTYDDSTHLTLATVFDPYESKYQLTTDSISQCFINIFFDLCEIQKRILESALTESKHDPAQIKLIYNDFLKGFESEKSKYIHSYEKKDFIREMKPYNRMVLDKLGIDNLQIFLQDR